MSKNTKTDKEIDKTSENIGAEGEIGRMSENIGAGEKNKEDASKLNKYIFLKTKI